MRFVVRRRDWSSCVRHTERGSALLLPLSAIVLLLAVGALLFRKADDRLRVSATAIASAEASLSAHEQLAAAISNYVSLPPQSFGVRPLSSVVRHLDSIGAAAALIAPLRSDERTLLDWGAEELVRPRISCMKWQSHRRALRAGEMHGRAICEDVGSEIREGGILSGDLHLKDDLQVRAKDEGTLVMIRGAAILEGSIGVEGTVEIHAIGPISLKTISSLGKGDASLRVVSRTGDVVVTGQLALEALCDEGAADGRQGSGVKRKPGLRVRLEGSRVVIRRAVSEKRVVGCILPEWGRMGGADFKLVGYTSGAPLSP